MVVTSVSVLGADVGEGGGRGKDLGCHGRRRRAPRRSAATCRHTGWVALAPPPSRSIFRLATGSEQGPTARSRCRTRRLDTDTGGERPYRMLGAWFLRQTCLTDQVLAFGYRLVIRFRSAPTWPARCTSARSTRTRCSASSLPDPRPRTSAAASRGVVWCGSA